MKIEKKKKRVTMVDIRKMVSPKKGKIEAKLLDSLSAHNLWGGN